jgi:plasmid stabilization system protein ParE
MALVTWSATAQSDLRRILNRIAAEASPRSAAKWADKHRDAAGTLATLPEIGSPVGDAPISGLREQIVGSYRLIYRYDGNECLILTVARAEQDLRRLLAPEDTL